MAVTNNNNFQWWRNQQKGGGQQPQQAQQQTPMYQPQQKAANGGQGNLQFAPANQTANGSRSSGNSSSTMPSVGAAPTYSESTNPGSYNNRYSAAMNWILEQIKNRGKFKYEFNSDPLFHAYADEYTQRGRQGMRDTMGQAAAMTGGYGNSYADVAGQQTYQQYMTQLLDRGLDLRDRAYQMNQDEIADLYNQYNLMAQQEQQDYNRWQDAVAAYQAWLAMQEQAAGGGYGGHGGRQGSGYTGTVIAGPNGTFFYYDSNGQIHYLNADQVQQNGNPINYTGAEAANLISGAQNAVGNAVGNVLGNAWNGFTNFITGGGNNSQQQPEIVKPNQNQQNHTKHKR